MRNTGQNQKKIWFAIVVFSLVATQLSYHFESFADEQIEAQQSVEHKGIFSRIWDYITNKKETSKDGAEQKTPPGSGSIVNMPSTSSTAKPKGYIKDVVTCGVSSLIPGNNPNPPVVMKALSSDMVRLLPLDTLRQSWVQALKELVTKGPTKDPKDPADKNTFESVFWRRWNEGLVPHPCIPGFNWSEDAKDCVKQNYFCPAFNGIGDDLESFGRLNYGDPDAHSAGIYHQNPSKLFSEGYMTIIETDVSTGTRYFSFIPNKIEIFKNTQLDSGIPSTYQPNDTRPHNKREAFDSDTCSNGTCYTGRLRYVFGTCTPDPNRFPKDDNSFLLTSGDPCAFFDKVNASSATWQRPLNLIQWPAGILDKSLPGSTSGTYSYYVFDLPVNPDYIKSLGCGTYYRYLADREERMLGPTTSNLFEGDQTAGQTALFMRAPGSPATSNACPAGGYPPTDSVGQKVVQLFQNAQPIDPTVLRPPTGLQVNYTSIGATNPLGLPSQKHLFDIDGLSHGDKFYGDFMGYDVSVLSTIKAIRTRLLFNVLNNVYPPVIASTAPLAGNTSLDIQSGGGAVSSGGLPPSNQDSTSPVQIQTSSTSKTSPILLSELYLLNRIIEELENPNSVNFYWGDLSRVSGSTLHLYDPQKGIILDNSLRSAAQFQNSYYSSMTDGGSVSTLKDVSKLVGPVIHAMAHHVIYLDSKTKLTNPPQANPSPGKILSFLNPIEEALAATDLAPQLSAVVPPSASSGNNGTSLPSIGSCSGLYFNYLGGTCESKTGFLFSGVCEPVMASGESATEIIVGESAIRLLEFLALHYLEEVEDIKVQLQCSLGNAIYYCNPFPQQVCTRPGDNQPCTYPPSGPNACPDNASCSQKVANCSNTACLNLFTDGSCYPTNITLPQPGFVAGLLCDSGSGKLLGRNAAPFNIPNFGLAVPKRPENYFLPHNQIHNLLASGRYSDALALSAMTIEAVSLLPPPPTIQKISPQESMKPGVEQIR